MACFAYGYGQSSFDPAVPSTESQEQFLLNAFTALTAAGRLPSDAVWAGFVRDDATATPVKFCQRRAASLMLGVIGPQHVIMAYSHDRIFVSVNDACETL